jgi:hypothetical protein
MSQNTNCGNARESEHTSAVVVVERMRSQADGDTVNLELDLDPHLNCSAEQ